MSRCGGDAASSVAEEEAAGEDNSEREQPERPAADAAPRRRVPPRGPRRGLDLGRRLLAGRAEFAERRVLERGRRVADAWRRVRCGFLERGLVRGRVRRRDGLVLLVRRFSGLVLLVCRFSGWGTATVCSGSPLPRRTNGSSALDAYGVVGCHFA